VADDGITDDIEALREQLARAEEAIRRCQGVVCALRDADVLSPEETELVELVEARDFMRTRLSRMLSCRRTPA
jgi:hypothetical protein